MKFKDIVAVVPVREGSSRIKEKVLRPFHDGKSLTEWKVEQLIDVLPPNQIYVSTESQKIIDQVLKYDVKIHHRDDYLSVGHQAPFNEVITGIIKDIPGKYIAWITAVVPLMRPNEYKTAFEKFLDNCIGESRNTDSLVTVNLLKEYLWKEDGPLNYEANKNHTISQNLPNIYRVTNGLYMRSKNEILKDEYFLGKNPYFHIVDKFSGIDIDEWDDFELSQFILNSKNS
jgi:N-acylneuraminate cytidylyltransferase